MDDIIHNSVKPPQPQPHRLLLLQERQVPPPEPTEPARSDQSRLIVDRVEAAIAAEHYLANQRKAAIAGGKSRSEAKRAAVRRNLERARANRWPGRPSTVRANRPSSGGVIPSTNLLDERADDAAGAASNLPPEEPPLDADGYPSEHYN